MSVSFSELMASFREEKGRFQIDIPEGWMQGRTTYGGLSAALCLEGALRAFPDLPPLRSAQISFIGPAGGAVGVEATILRAGKSVTFLGADLHAEKGLATRAVFAFGAARETQYHRMFIPAADLPAPEACEPYIPGGFGPSFAQHFEVLLAKGGRPVTGSSEHDHFLWVRHRSAEEGSVAALLALADMPPPAMMPMFTSFAPVSSVTWFVNFLVSAPATREGWWLLETRAESAGEGYSSQDMLIWNRDGEPVVAGRQLVAIFA